ncbi:alcohol dehydrogenase catalytic domain-containing protein [Candidatus Pelagibacter sp.]|nr:alcohol dehydrogenase catalytic domain-containing protein [Candidatus Pelagibacter sp.]
MKIALLTKKKKFEISDEKITRKLKDDEVLVKISGTGICGSDLHFFRNGALGSMPPKFPLSLGHETAGIIMDRNKSNFKNYTNVVIDPLDISACKNIEKNLCGCGLKHNLCNHQTYLGSHPTKGSFRELMVLKKSQLTILNNKIDPKISSMIEPAGIAQYCIDRAIINKNLDNKILILGCGAISMLISSILHSMGVKNITILDKVNDRLLYAKKFFKAKKLIKQDLKKNTNPENNDYNYVFDLITNNESFDYGIKAINKSGKYIIVGIPETEDYIRINPHKSRIKEIDILNIRRSNVKFNRMQNIIIKYSIPISRLATHYFKLEDIQKGFEMASSYSNKIIRGIVY